MTARYSTLVSVAAAARAVHMRPDFVRDFAIRRGICVKHGKRVRKVSLEKLRIALAEPDRIELHPGVRC